MTDLQQQVQEAIDQLVESGAERGLQVAVYRDGEQVVDAVAGVADPQTGRPVTSDTPFYAYSVGKGATVAHVLVERGLFGYCPGRRRLRGVPADDLPACSPDLVGLPGGGAA
jgi:CubicO group peptidase (beta-lactamase class C family)